MFPCSLCLMGILPLLYFYCVLILTTAFHMVGFILLLVHVASKQPGKCTERVTIHYSPSNCACCQQSLHCLLLWLCKCVYQTMLANNSAGERSRHKNDPNYRPYPTTCARGSGGLGSTPHCSVGPRSATLTLRSAIFRQNRTGW